MLNELSIELLSSVKHYFNSHITTFNSNLITITKMLTQSKQNYLQLKNVLYIIHKFLDINNAFNIIITSCCHCRCYSTDIFIEFNSFKSRKRAHSIRFLRHVDIDDVKYS